MVESETAASELWIEALFVDAQHVPPAAPNEFTATGKITLIKGTQAGIRLGSPLTASVLLAPFGIGVVDNGSTKTAGVTESEAQINFNNYNLGKWTSGIGKLSPEGIKLETDETQNATYITFSRLYNFEINADSISDGTNTVMAQEVFNTREMQGAISPVDGTVFLERTVLSSFRESLVEYGRIPNEPIVQIPTISLYGLVLTIIGLILVARYRLSSARHQSTHSQKADIPR